MPRSVKRVAATLGLVTALSAATACFHATVDTGRPAGTTVVQKPWVSTFVFGLVPAAQIDVTRQCPGGVARVETQQSFLNGLVGAITYGIYTPLHVTTTCANSAPSAQLGIPLERLGYVAPSPAASAPAAPAASDSTRIAR